VSDDVDPSTGTQVQYCWLHPGECGTIQCHPQQYVLQKRHASLLSCIGFDSVEIDVLGAGGSIDFETGYNSF